MMTEGWIVLANTRERRVNRFADAIARALRMICRFTVAPTEAYRRCKLFFEHLQLDANRQRTSAIIGGFSRV